jgi:serine/threonine protein kinase
VQVVGGRYEPRDQLGQGGMATVWSAWDTRLQRLVAIKVLSKALVADPSFVDRFGREARHAAALSHPNIVTIFDFAHADDSAYLVMELVEGESLADRLRRQRRLDVAQTGTILAGVLDGLGAAHRRGIVHRDVKPSNILLGRGGVVKVADFGIARVSGDGTQLTDTGMVMGTVGYLSPEQCAGETATDRSDIYAVGCVAFECLAGRPVFTGETPVSVMYQHQQAQPPDLNRLRPEVGPGLAQVIDESLAKDPRDRFASAAEMRRAVLGSIDANVNTADAPLAPGPPLAVDATRPWTRTVPLHSPPGPPLALDATRALTKTMPRPPTAGPPRRPPIDRRRTLGVVALVAAIGLIVGVVAATSSGAPGGLAISHSPSTTSTTVASTSKHRAATTTGFRTVSLPVVACDTSFGVASGTTSPPRRMTIKLPNALASRRLAFYASSDNSVAVLAPSGWSCAAQVGADGSASLVAVPPAEASVLGHGPHRSIDPGQESTLAEAITLSDTGGCVGCASTLACGLFGQATSTPTSAPTPPQASDDAGGDAADGPGKSHGHGAGKSTGPGAVTTTAPPAPACNTSPPAQEEVTMLSGSVAAFEDPAGVRGTGVPSGGANPANGILTYASGAATPASYLSTCTLPEHDHSLCTAVLNDVLKRYWNF